MTTLITKKFGNHVAQQLIESITEPSNTVYYVTASKHVEYEGGDDVVPAPVDSYQETNIALHQETIFGKKVTSSDVMRMVPRYDWTSNTVYARYDHTDGDLFTKQFYTVVDAGSYYYVYKVLDNAGNTASTVQPSNTSESACNFVTTLDGYRWKLLYKMDEATFEKFATTDYMPVVTSANVSGNSISGSIDAVTVTTPGSNYVSVLTGQFTSEDLRELIPTVSGNNLTYRLNSNAASNSNFYDGSSLYISAGTGYGQIGKIVGYNASTRVILLEDQFSTPPSTDSEYIISPTVVIDGDGTGASGYASISSNSTVTGYVDKIEIVSGGSGYTYATGTVVGNTGGVSNNAVLNVVIPPPGGHGTNAPSELGSSQLGISIAFNTNESGYITTFNDYRQISLIKDPLFESVTLTLDGDLGTYIAGENIYQVSFKNLTGTVTTSTSCTSITGALTDFNNSLVTGDNVVIFDTTNSLQCLRTVTGVVNSTSFSVNAAPSFTASFATLAHATILATGVKTGNTTPYLTMSNTEPKFVTGKKIIGSSSGAWANVSAIYVQEKPYNNWNTFDNRTRISYTSSTDQATPDAQMYQFDMSVANAYFHSANSTYVFLTSEKGPINADPSLPLQQEGSSAQYVLGSVKYKPDLIKGSGDTLYIENKDPISRSNSQSETIKLVLQF